MPEYLAPGVYVEEVDAGPRPIEGVSTSTIGFVGMTARGPISGPPRLVTSFSDYWRRFGGYLPEALGDSRFLAHAVRGAFENGARRIYIQRVVNGTQSVEDSAGASSPPSCRTAASNAAGARGPVDGVVTRLFQNVKSGMTTIKLTSLRGIQNDIQLTFTQIKDGVTTGELVSVSNYDASKGIVTLATVLQNDYDYRHTSVHLDIAGAYSVASDSSATQVVLAAADPGAWGNDISIQIYHTSLASAEVLGLAQGTDGTWNTVRLSTTKNHYVGEIIEFDLGATKTYGHVTAIHGDSIVVFPAFGSQDAWRPSPPVGKTMARSCEFRIVASYNGVTEDFPNLTLDNSTVNYYATVINRNSTLLAIPVPVPEYEVSPHPFLQPSGADGLHITLAGGADGSAPREEDYIGTDGGPGNRTGIQSLVDIDEISIVAIPGITSQSVQNALITQCETLKDRFAILDGEYRANEVIDSITVFRRRYDTKYAALYCPRLLAMDPVSSQEIALPPSGHVAGIYARTDIERGVHKAPANMGVRGITGVDLLITKHEQDILNPNQINVIRDFRSEFRGIRIWGARCLTSDSAWKYVPVRRLFIFVEESLEEGLQWVVFEPNAESLWASVIRSVKSFLHSVWRSGALMGTTQDEAFFVKCDRETMTQDDIDNGRLIVLVGIAPVKPAEFVIVRIQQYTAEANIV